MIDALNVADIPWQIVVPETDDMEIVGVRLGSTVRIIELLVAVVGETQVALLVNTQVILSLLMNDDDE